MSVEGGEDLRCDRDGYFDLESLKPYSSVWVSTRRDTRPKLILQEEDNDNKKNVMPSRACNNLHSLLEIIEASPSSQPSEENIDMQVQQLSSTKSDHFPRNPYKIFERSDSVALRKISDKIIESMCKSDPKTVCNEVESGKICTPNKRPLEPKHSDHELQEHRAQEEDRKEETSEEEEPKEKSGTVLHNVQKKNDDEPMKEKNTNEPSDLRSHPGGGEPQENNSTKCKLLSDSGKLVTEMNLTALKLKDQTGREFPVTVKYIWETDVNEITKVCDKVFDSSPAFVKLTESVSAVGMKLDTSNLTISPVHTGKAPSWQDRSKSQSSCSQLRNMKRIESWNSDVKEADSNPNVQGSKGDASNTRKVPFKEVQTIKNSVIRSKASIVESYCDKKLFDNLQDYGKYPRHPDGHREGSKIYASERKALSDKKNKIPVKKKYPVVEELKGPNTAARPATFNKREPVPRPAPNRPPSAPTRETTSKIPQRIAVQDSGDKLPQSFNKRQFGTKFQAPTPASSSNKFWK